jgi:hypothetical protein
MRQRIYKELEALERMAALETERRASAGTSRAREILCELLLKYAVEPLAEESEVEAIARAAGTNAREIRELLDRQAQGVQ